MKASYLLTYEPERVPHWPWVMKINHGDGWRTFCRVCDAELLIEDCKAMGVIPKRSRAFEKAYKEWYYSNDPTDYN